MEIRGNVILVRLKNLGLITSDTTLTSICERFDIKYDKIRTKKYPFWFDHNGESFHFQRMRVREDVQIDDFRKVSEK